MNILYIAHRIPYPPDKGDKIRSFHQIRCLSKEHTIHLVCFVDDKEDLQHVRALKKYCVSVDAIYRSSVIAKLLAVLAIFTNWPLSVASFYSRKLKNTIIQKLSLNSFDGIFIFCSPMAEYVRHVSEIPKIIDFVDVDSEKWRLYADYHRFPMSWVYQLEADRLSRYEKEIANIFDHSVIVSEEEAGLFKRKVGERPISGIPNGVDLDYFAPSEDPPSYSSQPAIVFTGVMDYFPNVDAVTHFCTQIFPLIRQALPEAWFYIVGRNPTRRVRALGRLSNVTVTGSVDDVRPYLATARVAVAPLRIARGIQNKVLEAMAMGLPVVGTSEAFRGIQATMANGIRVADTSEEFAQEVLAFLQNPRLRHECSLQARCYVQHNHTWSDYGARLISLVRQVTGQSTLEQVCC